jgi:acyl-coenzyme A synthetase/AMP-(fatty) acid ligase
MFLIDKNLNVSYESLISDLNNGFNSHLLCSFIRNILNNKEINLTSHKQYNEPVENAITSKKELINRIYESKSVVSLQTSGTTGERKTIKHKISDLLLDTKRIHNDSVWLYTYNPFHMGGVQVFLQALINGNTIVYAYKKDRRYILKSIKEFGVTHISSTPTFYKLLSPFEEAYESVVRTTVGGERVDSFTLELIKQMFPNAKVTNIYALTEAGSVLYSSDDIFTLNQKCKIIDDVLYVKDRSEEWCNTGDSVKLVNQNSFRFMGRRKNIINIAGNDVNPAEIEDLLKENEGVQDAVVYSKSTSLLGDVLVCDIIKCEQTITEKEIKKFFKDKGLEDYQIPRIINFIDKLKISDNIKISA